MFDFIKIYSKIEIYSLPHSLSGGTTMANACMPFTLTAWQRVQTVRIIKNEQLERSLNARKKTRIDSYEFQGFDNEILFRTVCLCQ